MELILVILGALTWRIRGGLKVPFTDKKFPLNKLWFAAFMAFAAWVLTKCDFNHCLIVFIASVVSTQVYGWGEYIGCLICGDKPSKRSDCDLVDEIIDNLYITIKGTRYNLIDFPVLWGWVGLSLRGLITSFIAGLALDSIPFMITGLAMGTVYWLGGQFNRLYDDGKCGWKWSEWFYGATQALFLWWLL